MCTANFCYFLVILSLHPPTFLNYSISVLSAVNLKSFPLTVPSVINSRKRNSQQYCTNNVSKQGRKLLCAKLFFCSVCLTRQSPLIDGILEWYSLYIHEIGNISQGIYFSVSWSSHFRQMLLSIDIGKESNSLFW